MLRISILLLMLSGEAAAEVRRIEVKVAATVEVEVGNLIGFICDQPKLLDAAMQTRKRDQGEVNVFVVKGVSPGTTQCRVGSDVLGGSRLFEVVVREKE